MKLLKIKELWKEKPEDEGWKENILYIDTKKIWCIVKTDIEEVWKVWLTESFENNHNSILISTIDKEKILNSRIKNNF